MAHGCTFVVWKKSMNLRYIIEAIVFFFILMFFQYEVSLFNKDLHLSMAEMQLFGTLSKEITARGGQPFDPENPDANKDLLDGRLLFQEEISDNSNDDRIREGKVTSSWFFDESNESKQQDSRGRNLAFKFTGEADRANWTLTEL